ncbi:MAG: 16S rRNA processing protein RimM [Ktedonobacterales bacterium]|nr:16S rRNA processing protein RimM [Ktedonobacterales bacterium]
MTESHANPTEAAPSPTASPDHHQSARADDAWAAIGEVVGTFGIRGELKVNPLTDFPDRFLRTRTLYMSEPRMDDTRTPHDIAHARTHKGQVILRLAGIETVDQAERLRGAWLWIPTSEITPLPPDQFYLHDVVGLRVEDMAGQCLGEVKDVLTGVGNDLLVVRAATDGREVLLPAVKAFIKTVDLAAGLMRVEPIPGLFDEGADEAR